MARKTNKSLRKLDRLELLELLVEQGEELERTQEALHAAEERAKQQERIARLAEDAVSKLAGVLEAAQIAQVQYTDKLRDLKIEMGLKTEVPSTAKDAESVAAAEASTAPSVQVQVDSQQETEVFTAPTTEPAAIYAAQAAAEEAVLSVPEIDTQETMEFEPVAVAEAIPEGEPVYIEADEDEVFDAEDFVKNTLGISTGDDVSYSEDYEQYDDEGIDEYATDASDYGYAEYYEDDSEDVSERPTYSNNSNAAPYMPFLNSQGVVVLE